MFSSIRKPSRLDRRHQLNSVFSSLPAFRPWKNDCRIVHIHRSTPSSVLYALIDYAQETTEFTIDTESDYRTHQPALIQIEFIRSKPIVVLFEMCHLSKQQAFLSSLVRILIRTILMSSKTIFAWGDPIEELAHFARYGFFSYEHLVPLNVVDVQDAFKQWYNRTFHHRCGLEPDADDHPTCTCCHRPVKDLQHRWSLQKAIAFTFGEFLDKSRTLSHWSRFLSSTNSTRALLVEKTSRSMVDNMILYAVDDCLAVTKLKWVIECFDG